MNYKEISYKTGKGPDGTLVIQGEFIAAGASFSCVIGPRGEGGNAASIFSLKFAGGQATGVIQMSGEWERAAFKELLQLVLENL